MLVVVAVGLVSGCDNTTETPVTPIEQSSQESMNGESAGNNLIMAAYIAGKEWTQPLGSVSAADFTGYCRFKGYEKAMLYQCKNAGCWKCYKGNGAQGLYMGIDVSDLCRQMYRAPYSSVQAYNTNWSNSLAWQCKGYKPKWNWQ